MAMDFFSRQDQARKKTWLLAFYFLIAVALIVLALNGAFYLLVRYIQPEPLSLQQWLLEFNHWKYVTGFTVWIIFIVSATRIFFLRGGGAAVAKMAGATPIDVSSRDLHIRRLVNIAEEMAIASGVAMPELWVMTREDGINAFVAGYHPDQTVLVVTQGALDNLNRDELQGVVGHEFSHILNGDMRINVHLIGILAGILFIGQIGLWLIRHGFYAGEYSQSRRDNRVTLIVLLTGLVIAGIGYIGVFFGRLIKAAISREREYLADAASVQFTRNPQGLAGALWKIATHAQGAQLNGRHAEEMSHLCFGANAVEGMFARLSGWLSTHPPLETRIKAIAPGFVGGLYATKRADPALPDEVWDNRDLEQATLLRGLAPPLRRPAPAATPPPMPQPAPSALAATVGTVTPAGLDYAIRLRHAIPQTIHQQLHQPNGARAVMYALLLPPVGASLMRKQALRYIQTLENAELAKLSAQLEPLARPLGVKFRLPLADLALPALRSLTEPQKATFDKVCQALIKLDGKVSLLEFTLSAVLRSHLFPAPKAKAKFRNFQEVRDELCVLLSVVAHASAAPLAQREAVYLRNMQTFDRAAPPLLPVAQLGTQRLDQALQTLDCLPMMLKRNVITACADCVISDGMVEPVEMELLRAIADTLGCPMPPLPMA